MTNQPDNQTDQAKYTHFKSAIFDVDGNWTKLETLPVFVKTVFKQQEVCPTTQNLHFQVHVVCNRQVRPSQMYGWIAQTKWFGISAKDKQHIQNSINYCSKKETAVEGTQETVEGYKYYQVHELLFIVAQQYTKEDEDYTNVKEWTYKRSWPCLTSRLIQQDITWATRLCNPALEKCWKNWGTTFIEKVKAQRCLIIEGSASEAPAEEE